MSLGVLIPVHNGLPETKETLRSLFAATSVTSDVHVVVVDDGSTDGSGAWIAANYPAVHLLAGSGDLWWSGAMNVAARYALDVLHVDYCVCWNNDIRCAPDYFVRLQELLVVPGGDHLLASKVYFLDRPDIICAMGALFDPGRCRSALIGSGDRDSSLYSGPRRVDWASGMGTVVHREVFDKIGLWDARTFPQYCGDSDFGLRAKQAGIQMTVRPEICIWNDKRTTGISRQSRLLPFLCSFVRLNSNYHLLTQLRFFRRYAASWRGWLTFATMYGGYIGGFIKWSLLGLTGRQRPAA
jgi:GT2 family glycosyltransferase